MTKDTNVIKSKQNAPGNLPTDHPCCGAHWGLSRNPHSPTPMTKPIQAQTQTELDFYYYRPTKPSNRPG